MNMNATAQMVTVSQGGKPREKPKPATGEIGMKDGKPYPPPMPVMCDNRPPDQSPATGEWTAERIASYMTPDYAERLAIDINAALASAQPKPASGERYVMRDHMIFDTHVDAFIGAGDACYLLNEANAALAAEREKVYEAVSQEKAVVISEVIKLREQLAAKERVIEDFGPVNRGYERRAKEAEKQLAKVK